MNVRRPILDSFYIHLPSNASMHVYENNTASHYRVNLPKAIKLDGRWEVALSEIHYPHSWRNVDTDDAQISYSYVTQGLLTPNLRRRKRLAILPGYYHTEKELVRELSSSLHQGFRDRQIPPVGAIKLDLETITGHSVVHLKKGYGLTLPKTLASMLGFNNRHRFTDKSVQNKDKDNTWLSFRSDRPADTRRGLFSIYVYCSIIMPCVVGDRTVPLLRVVPIKGKRNDYVSTVFTNPIYVDVQQKYFTDIEIELRSDTGEYIMFESGKTFITLHFRKLL